MQPDESLFSAEELTRIYRETAAAAEETGDRLTVLLAPYAGVGDAPVT
jgi:hypothetical protein